jgi:Zn-dependent M32 family carboxypeptidase
MAKVDEIVGVFTKLERISYYTKEKPLDHLLPYEDVKEAKMEVGKIFDQLKEEINTDTAKVECNLTEPKNGKPKEQLSSKNKNKRKRKLLK